MEGGSRPLPMSTGIITLQNMMQKYMYVVYMHMYMYMQFKFSFEDAVQRGTKEQLYPSSLLFDGRIYQDSRATSPSPRNELSYSLSTKFNIM